MLNRSFYFLNLNIFGRSLRIVYILSQLAQTTPVMENWKPAKFSPHEQFGNFKK